MSLSRLAEMWGNWLVDGSSGALSQLAQDIETKTSMEVAKAFIELACSGDTIASLSEIGEFGERIGAFPEELEGEDL